MSSYIQVNSEANVPKIWTVINNKISTAGSPLLPNLLQLLLFILVQVLDSPPFKPAIMVQANFVKFSCQTRVRKVLGIHVKKKKKKN